MPGFGKSGMQISYLRVSHRCDDLLATGGTAAAAASLVKQSGGKVAALAFVIEIGDLNGGKLLSPHKRISLVVY